MRFTAEQLREKANKWNEDERVSARCIVVAEQAARDAAVVEQLIALEPATLTTEEALREVLALITQAKEQP